MTAVVDARVGQRFIWGLVAASLVPFVAGPLVGALGSEPAVWALATVALGAPHVGTSAAFYFDGELRWLRDADRARFYLWPLVAVLVGLAVALTATPTMRVYAVAGFLGWQLHHFTRQNLGCFAFLCRARGMAGPTEEERRLLDLTTVAGVCAIPSALIEQSIPGEDALMLAGGLVMVVTATRAWHAARLSGDPLRAAALAFVVAFYLPLYVFDGGAALLGYALAHGAQYLLMVGHLPGHRVDGRRMTLAVVGGFAMVGLPLYWAMGHTGQPIVFGLFYGVTATHFIIDAGIWKMRDPEQRAYMRRRFAFL